MPTCGTQAARCSPWSKTTLLGHLSCSILILRDAAVSSCSLQDGPYLQHHWVYAIMIFSSMLQEREAAAKQQEMEEARREAMEKAKEYEDVRSEVRCPTFHYSCS